MPTSLRNSRSLVGSCVVVWPATSILPAWKVSSPLMQRSSVDLPEPERPMMATTCPVSTLSETPFSTSSEPKRLWTSSMRTAGIHHLFEMAAEPGQGETDREIDEPDQREDLEGLIGRVVDQHAGAHQIDEADDLDDGGILHELDQEPDRRRQRDPDRLR